VNEEPDIAARTLQIHSTPTVFVNGVRLSGEASLAKFDELLAPPPR
jgi:protein-disulfide isomerase